MKTRSRWVAVLGAGLAFVPWAGFGQAITVSPSGAMTQEQAAPAIPPEDQATKEQLAKLFEVMRIRQQMQSMRRIVPMMVESQMREQLKTMNTQVAGGPKTTADQRAAIEQILRKYVDQAVNLYPIDEMIDDMTGLYQEHLSREDVDALIAFYSSPAGQHLLDAQPKIAQEYMPLVMRRAQERTKTLTAEMMKDLAALKQASKPAAPATNK
ncbi:MAG TPA: DUF2059 domain-containing protein [Terracidiphilus sp.]|jgi:hypothetical protein|nr:DUF2059 domain-containing protein [Terracidiphilus sp.]